MSNVIPINSDAKQQELEKISETIVLLSGCSKRLVDLDKSCSTDDMANMNLSVLDMISFLEMYRSEKHG
jgi:hypothetical protein|tara:strand:+ start:320 stop:526 length:207 start_codon:yes stop_codon:yes gene_type:complete